MKKLIIYLTLAFCSQSFAQIAIGKSSVEGSSILDFPTGTNNGILLPLVDTTPSSPSQGTWIYDRNTKKVRYYDGTQWQDATDAATLTLPAQNPSAETGAGVIIGASTSSAEGVLVLESSTKALTLPKVTQPEANVPSPYPGMMCYDTTSKTIAVFNGEYWFYLK